MAERKTYSAEQKAEALKKVAELGITKAAKELGISHVTLAKWRVDAGVDTAKKKVEKAAKDVADQATATTIEAKKNGRAAGRKAKEKIKQVAEEAASALEKAAEDAAETADAVKETIKAPVKKAKTAKLNMVIQSQAGGAISTDQIAAKLPADATDCYVKAEENRVYYVLKDGSTGSIAIWE